MKPAILSHDAYLRAVTLRDLSDPAQGPHAIQLLLDRIIHAPGRSGTFRALFSLSCTRRTRYTGGSMTGSFGFYSGIKSRDADRTSSGSNHAHRRRRRGGAENHFDQGKVHMVDLGDRVSGQFLDGGGAVYNVRHSAFGAVGDGVTADGAAFTAAEASGDQCYAPAGTYRITANLTLTKAWAFARGAKLSIASGVTVTMHELPEAGNWQVFDGDGGVLFTGSAAGAQVNARWFGAVPGDTTLVSFSQNVGSSLQYAVTQQTRAGVAFARALDSLAEAGGTLYIPAGLYWTYAYTVVDVDNVAIRGDGSGKTIVRTLASAPSTNGYGVIQMGHSHASRVTAGPYERMSIEGITLDGNIQNRADPTTSYQLYAFILYYTRRFSARDVHATNGGVDSFALAGLRDVTEGMQYTVQDCLFERGYRLSMLCNASEVKVINTTIRQGGVPHGGQQPRAALDIEPNQLGEFGWRNITFTNCTLEDSARQLFAVTNSDNVRFNACTFRDTGTAVSSTLLGSITMSRVFFDACTFVSLRGLSTSTAVRLNATHNETYPEMAYKALTSVKNCSFLGCGVDLYTHYVLFEDNLVEDSPMAVVVQAPFAVVRGNTLVNTGWNFSNGGRESSLQIGNSSGARKKYVVQNNLARVDEHRFYERLLADVSPVRWYGIYLDTSNVETQLLGNRAEGFYRWPEVKGGSQNASSFRDWRSPSTPPADTTTSTSVVAGNTMGGSAWLPEQFHNNLV